MNVSSNVAAMAAQVTQLYKAYGSSGNRIDALVDVNLGIYRGQFTAIMGPSGSGKSTLMHIMAGLDSPTGGSVRLGETEISRLNDEDLTVLRRRRVGFVFQSFNLVPTLDILGNILLPIELDGRNPTSEEHLWVDRLVSALGLTDRLRHRPHELSGGQQQRVAIARALATRPDIIFADEPTGNLDSRSGREVLTLMRTASREYGQSIVMVTHDAFAASYADRVVFLADGQLVNDISRSSPADISKVMLEMESRS